MTEAEWISSSDPQAMLSHLVRNASARKLRLFAVACCRNPDVWSKLTDDSPCPDCQGDGYVSTPVWSDVPVIKCCTCSSTGRINRSRRAVEVAERHADGLATGDELKLARRASGIALLTLLASASDAARHVAEFLRLSALRGEDWALPSATQIALLRDLFGNPFWPVTEPSHLEDSPGGSRKRVWDEVPWLVDSTVVSLATAICEERAFERMPILGDALEDAGCTDEAVLGHCRAVCPYCKDATFDHGGPLGSGTETARWLNSKCVCGGTRLVTHVRGCWVVDLILGKS